MGFYARVGVNGGVEAEDDLVAGSEIAFAERGTHELKGIPGGRLFALQNES